MKLQAHALRIARLFPACVLVALMGACSGSGGGACNPSTCDGCCVGDVCQLGSEANACGQGGQQCDDCSSRSQRCNSGACVANSGAGACAGVTCNTPPAASCLDAVTLRSYASAGTCNPSSGQCSYTTTDTTCLQGCQNGACLGGPCGGVDLQNDPKNCGGCGHDCLGGGCQAGECQPVTLASSPSPPNGIAVDASAAYWTTLSGRVMTVPLGGGIPVTLASGQSSPAGVAVDASAVYWTNYNSSGTAIMKVAK